MGENSKRGFGEGRSPTKFSYTYEDVANALGCSVQAARKHAQRGNFDPNDLLSVLEFLNERLQKPGRAAGLTALSERVRELAGE